jgi:O-antigen/teichoic acid export membrane protein
MRALLAASYAPLFREGAYGIHATVRASRSLFAPGFIYSGTVGVALYFTAPLLPHILGNSYSASVSALRLLAVLPLLKCMHFLAANALTGALRQRARTKWQVVIALANIGLNLWAIPVYGWRGAVATSLFSDAALAVGLWFIVARELRRSPNPGYADPAPLPVRS